MTAPNCVDMSRWGGELTEAEAACMKAAGVHTVIVATGPGGYGMFAEQQANAAIRAGMGVEAYTYLEFEQDPDWWVDQATARLAAVHVRRWWLDVEDTEHGKDWTPQHRRDYVARALDRFRFHGIKAHIYTGGWYWRPYMGDWTGPAEQGRLLWNSYYDDDPDIDGVPYGGWPRATVAIEQYQGTSDVCGQSVDQNWMYIMPTGVPAPGAGDGMTANERQLLLVVASLLAGHDDGRLFATVEEALATLGPLEDPGDKRVLLGLDGLQKRVGQVEALLSTMPIGGPSAPAPATGITRDELARYVETAAGSLAWDIRNGGRG